MTPSTHFTAGNTPDAPRSDLPGLLAALATDLQAMGYTVDGVAALLGGAAYTALSRDQLIPALIVTEVAAKGEPETAALAAVVRLWLLAEPQRAETLDAALPGIRTQGLLELGLVETSAEGLIQAKADLRPYGWEAAAGEAAAGEEAAGSRGGGSRQPRGGPLGGQ